MNPYDVSPVLRRILSGSSGITDLMITPGNMPKVIQGGSLENAPLKDLKGLNAYQTEILAASLLRGKPALQKLFRETGTATLSYTVPKVSHFRVSLIRQVNGISCNFRVIPYHPPTMESLGLPRGLASVLEYEEGLILCTSRSGGGKTTTMAAMLNQLSTVKPVHIMTVEAPVEYHINKGVGLVQQIETEDANQALIRGMETAMTQSCRVIACSSLDHPDTLKLAINASESGHLVLGTLTAPSAAATIEKVRHQLTHSGELSRFARELRCIVSQRLLPRKDNKGRVAAFEIVRGGDAVTHMIMRGGGVDAMTAIHQQHAEDGMQSLQKDLDRLQRADLVSAGVAKRYLPDSGPTPEPKQKEPGSLRNELELDDSIALEVAAD